MTNEYFNCNQRRAAATLARQGRGLDSATPRNHAASEFRGAAPRSLSDNCRHSTAADGAMEHQAPASAFDCAAQRAAFQLIHPGSHNSKNESPTPRPCLGDDCHGSHLINFPFALTVFMLLMIGAIVMCGGMMAPNVGATVTGFLLSLLGAALYCGRLADD